MRHVKTLPTLSTLAAIIAGTLAVCSAQAQFIPVYENLPTATSNLESHHGVGGPILADDFVPTMSGGVTQVAWWGSVATSSQWELAFHTNDPVLNQPNLDDPVEGAKVKYLGVTPLVFNVPGQPQLREYVANLPAEFYVNAGTEYWFTAANFDPGWTWALALNGPDIGSENFNAHMSVGNTALDGGPHGGPWTDVHTDLAFRVSVPEPGNIALIAGAGITGSLFAVRRLRRRKR